MGSVHYLRKTGFALVRKCWFAPRKITLRPTNGGT